MIPKREQEIGFDNCLGLDEKKPVVESLRGSRQMYRIDLGTIVDQLLIFRYQIYVVEDKTALFPIFYSFRKPNIYQFATIERLIDGLKCRVVCSLKWLMVKTCKVKNLFNNKYPKWQVLIWKKCNHFLQKHLQMACSITIGDYYEGLPLMYLLQRHKSRIDLERWNCRIDIT